MGIVARIVVYAEADSVAQNAVTAAFARIADLENVFSNYRANSEISRLQAPLVSDGSGSDHARGAPVSPDLLAVMLRSQVLWEASGGAFDPTVGPLTALWRTARNRGVLPRPAILEKARENVGWNHVRIDSVHGTVTLAREGIALDFGGIAKGYAADEAVRVLRKFGVSRALVELGGDIVAADPPPGKDGWRIDGSDYGAVEEIVVANAAVSTSGDSQQFVEIDGVRYSHVLDPRTGLGGTNGIVVTVVAADGLTSDGLATTVGILGEEAGRRTARELFPSARVYVGKAQ